MTRIDSPKHMTWAARNWSRWRQSALMSRFFGTSWRRLHSPTLFLWARALQSNPRHWPTPRNQETWLVNPVAIEAWRRDLLLDSSWIDRTDLGAGSRGVSGKPSTARIKDLARRSLTPARDVLALCRWLRCISPKGRFLELGTSLGVTAAHVASAGWRVETWEGCPLTLSKAREGWKHLGLHHLVQSEVGPFQRHLDALTPQQKWDVIFVDGFHEERATLNMIDRLAPHVTVCIVVDDIAWSPGMHRAWQALQKRSEWRVTFSWKGRGFLVKAPHMASQHVALA